MYPLPFTYHDLSEQFDPRFMARGEDYFKRGMVQQVEILEQGRRIRGRVHGSGRQVYRVDIAIEADDEGALIEGECSCPVGDDCKHVAATLLAALEKEAATKPFGNKANRDDRDEPAQEPIQHWLDDLARAARPPTIKDQHPPNEPRRLLYILDRRVLPGASWLTLELQIARKLKKGGYGKGQRYWPNTFANHGPRGFMLEADTAILRRLLIRRQLEGLPEDRLTGEDSGELLAKIVRTGYCHWQDRNSPALQSGDPRPGQLAWQLDEAGHQQLHIQTQPAATQVLPTVPPMYLDTAANCIGPVQLELPASLQQTLPQAPSVAPDQVKEVRKRLGKLGLDIPAPEPIKLVTRKAAPPGPVLHLTNYTETLAPMYKPLPFSIEPFSTALMQLRFDYDGTEVLADDETPTTQHRDGLTVIRQARDAKSETRAIERLRHAGAVRFIDEYGDEETPRASYVLPGEEHEEPGLWLDFMLEHLPRLRTEGWRIEIDAEFPYRLAETGSWSASVEPGKDAGWFDLELGVEVDGERIALLPLLLQFIQQHPQLAKSGQLPEQEFLVVPLEDGRLLPLPMERLGRILDTLVELYNPAEMDSDRLQLPNWRAAELAELSESAGLRWLGSERLKRYGEKLRHFNAIKPRGAPRGFKAELRPYQQAGVGWLQFLRQYDFNGVLADDMGLGKTIQALAHLLIEKQAGRADRPSLVIAPTSLMHNWRHEAARFAPRLKVLTLHGPQRQQDFAHIGDYDLVLSTYALLPRDESILTEQPWHVVILDEAQYIKNPRARATLAAHRLQAHHRLCLTGTPLENHLGELWSLFHFLMPGLLGDERQFRKLFRTPIENHDNRERAQRLSKRVAPFMLRRDKETVAADLPPRSEIIRSVPLEGAQRDLYESVRLAMHDKVKKAIDQKGLQRSHIVILDALLKLRQICCDPRLLKMGAAQKVHHSAKRELLMGMLPELLEEGRRILLFSQFTSMLGLIETELDKQHIPYAKLTGQTRNRARPIEQFQGKEVPLFLISLKAGGTGLNLTAADTVIHYDPWWNPAVEAQATDRAHRIGQDKPVFVYKLLTEGTVEERIQTMQARKRRLAEGLFDASGKGKLPGPEELESLFEPLF